MFADIVSGRFDMPNHLFGQKSKELRELIKKLLNPNPLKVGAMILYGNCLCSEGLTYVLIGLLGSRGLLWKTHLYIPSLSCL